jgi:hypothetical protein
MALTVVDNRVLGYYTILCGVSLNDLELDLFACHHGLRRCRLCEWVGLLEETFSYYVVNEVSF